MTKEITHLIYYGLNEVGCLKSVSSNGVELMTPLNSILARYIEKRIKSKAVESDSFGYMITRYDNLTHAKNHLEMYFKVVNIKEVAPKYTY